VGRRLSAAGYEVCASASTDAEENGEADEGGDADGGDTAAAASAAAASGVENVHIKLMM
jgi:hypothetical protein